MAAFDYRTFSSPDEVQTPKLTTVEMVDIADGGSYHIGPGHDAWVVDDEPKVIVESQTAAT